MKVTKETKTDSLLTRFWMRLSDRSKMPRRWWYPLLSSEIRPKTIVLDAHQKCSETITKAMLTVLGVALFCLLTAFGSPDKLLLAAESTIRVPFADAPISFLGFIVVAPLLLCVVAVYLHIFYGYWLELERERRQINQSLNRNRGAANRGRTKPLLLDRFGATPPDIFGILLACPPGLRDDHVESLSTT